MQMLPSLPSGHHAGGENANEAVVGGTDKRG